MFACFSLANPLSSVGDDDSYPNQLGPPKVAPIVITTLATSSIGFILSDGLHPRLDCMPIVKLVVQKIGLHTYNIITYSRGLKVSVVEMPWLIVIYVWVENHDDLEIIVNIER